MKLYAYVLLKNNSYQKISIFQALNNKKQFPIEWETMKYYLTDNPNNPIELIASGGNVKSSHFKFKSTKDEFIYLRNPNYKTSTHSLCQDVLSEFKNISIQTSDNNVLSFYNCICEKEKRIISDNKLYIADLYFTFEKSEPDYLAKAWDNHFIMEIKVTHEVPNSNKYGFYIDKHAVFELNASDGVRKIVESYQLTSELSLNNCTNSLIKMFTNKTYARLIVNPVFHDMYKYKINELHNEISILNKEKNNFKTNNNDIIEKYNNLVFKYNNIYKENQTLIDENKKLQLEIDTFYKSFAGKFYKVFNRSNDN